MADTGKTPSLRFQGYFDEWKQDQVGEFYDFKNGLNKGKEYFGTGIPIVNYSDVYNNRGLYAADLTGRVDLSPTEITNYEVKKGDIFFTRTSETLREIGYPAVMLDDPESTVFSGFVLRGRACGEDPLNLKFKQYVFFTEAFRREMIKKSSMTTRALTSGTAIKQMNFFYPENKEEQEFIGRFLDTFNTLLMETGNKIEKLDKLKKSMLDKLFIHDENSTMPSVRFGGFCDEWKQITLGEIVEKYEDPVPTPHGGYERLGIRSHAKGTFHNYVEEGHELNTAQMHRVATHKLIVNITFAWEHAVAITDEKDVGKLVSHRFPQFTFHEGMVPEFFRYVISDEKFRHHLWLSSPGGAGRNKVLNIDEMLEYKLRIPCYEEQKQIADFMDSIENLIDLYGQKLEQLQHIKSALLDKMFVS